MLCSLLRGEGDVIKEEAREVMGEEEVTGGPAAEGEGTACPLEMTGEGEGWPTDAVTGTGVSGLGWDDDADEEDDDEGEAAIVMLDDGWLGRSPDSA